MTALPGRSYKVQTKTSLATNIHWQNITNAVTITTNVVNSTNVITTNYVVTQVAGTNGVFTLSVTNTGPLRVFRASTP